jgi:hypothetical protein
MPTETAFSDLTRPTLDRQPQRLEEATAVLGLLAMLEGRRAQTAAPALAALLDNRTLLPAGEVLVRWADRSSTDS